MLFRSRYPFSSSIKPPFQSRHFAAIVHLYLHSRARTRTEALWAKCGTLGDVVPRAFSFYYVRRHLPHQMKVWVNVIKGYCVYVRYHRISVFLLESGIRRRVMCSGAWPRLPVVLSVTIQCDFVEWAGAAGLALLLSHGASGKCTSHQNVTLTPVNPPKHNRRVLFRSLPLLSSFSFSLNR